MKLYHVTDAANYDCILADGLLPRSMTGKPSNDETRATHPDAVYLSLVAQVYYAAEGTRVMVIEIDGSYLDHDRLYADEDWLFQGYDPSGVADPQELQNIYEKLALTDERCSLWRESLEAIGGVSYRGPIAPSAFTRISLIDIDDRQWLQIPAGAICIPGKWNLQQAEYAEWTKKIMGNLG